MSKRYWICRKLEYNMSKSEGRAWDLPPSPFPTLRKEGKNG